MAIRLLMAFSILLLVACGGGGGSTGPKIVWMTKEINISEGDQIRFDSLITDVEESPTIRFYKGGELVYEYDYVRVSGTGVRILRTIVSSARLSDSGDYLVVLYPPDSDIPYIESDIIPVRVAERTQPKESVDATPEQISWVAGMYDASIRDPAMYGEGYTILAGATTDDDIIDEAYYFIGDDGFIEVFDYRNDAIDSDGNCYMSSHAGKQNYGLQGKSVFWRDSNRSLVFVFKGEDGPVEGAIFINDSNQAYRVCISNVCSSGSGSVQIGGSSTAEIGSRIVTRDRVLNPTIEDVRSSMCE
jgi:hypothetical protein